MASWVSPPGPHLPELASFLMPPQPLPHLVTERLLLVLPTPDLAGRMVDYYRRNQEHLSPWEPWRGPNFLTAQWWRIQLEANIDEFHAGRSARLVVLLPNDPEGRVMGIANLSEVVRGAFQACYLGYSIDLELEGGGFMYEALDRLLQLAFEDMGLHRVMANYRPENERSGSLLARLGFEREGYARGYLQIDGAWRDHILTALTREPQVPGGRPRGPE